MLLDISQAFPLNRILSIFMTNRQYPVSLLGLTSLGITILHQPKSASRKLGYSAPEAILHLTSHTRQGPNSFLSWIRRITGIYNDCNLSKLSSFIFDNLYNRIFYLISWFIILTHKLNHDLIHLLQNWSVFIKRQSKKLSINVNKYMNRNQK